MIEQTLRCGSVDQSLEIVALTPIQFVVRQYATFFLYSMNEMFIVSQDLVNFIRSVAFEGEDALSILAFAVVNISAIMAIIFVIVVIVII